jgi:dsRNA-specific ribonuclease
MTRSRISRCTGQLLSAPSRAVAAPSLTAPIAASFRAPAPTAPHLRQTIRCQSTAAADALPESSSSLIADEEARTPYPSPLPSKARSSAKLAALHARLSLPEKLPLETLARCLVDPSADANPHFNNANLAVIGKGLISYHVSERLVVSYPRLPMVVLFEAVRAYAGPEALTNIAKAWGIDQAAAPGEEVDPGLLQFSMDINAGVRHTQWGYVRREAAMLDKFKWRRGVSSRVVLDNEFGDAVHEKTPGENLDAAAEEELATAQRIQIRRDAHSALVQSVVGALYIHAGREAARAFVDAHVIARRVDLESLFHFSLPTRELAMLCAREGFEPPVARLLSETGRKSRTPVFVVGIYSGADKLGEGSGASLDVARLKASMNALKAWYLYSPGQNVRVPSDMLREGAKPWQPVHIDIGEIV